MVLLLLLLFGHSSSVMQENKCVDKVLTAIASHNAKMTQTKKKNPKQMTLRKARTIVRVK